MQALSQEDYERLKWRVLRAFGVLPGEARARRMTDRDYLYCAAQMMLDEQEKLDAMCPSCRERAQRRLCRYAARKCRRKTRDLMKGGLRS